jgi:hypothetical protein
MNRANKNLKARALDFGTKSFNIQTLGLSRVERMNFEEFLTYKIQKDSELSFAEFRKMCGISRQQWDAFKVENLDKKIKWKVD